MKKKLNFCAYCCSLLLIYALSACKNNQNNDNKPLNNTITQETKPNIVQNTALTVADSLIKSLCDCEAVFFNKKIEKTTVFWQEFQTVEFQNQEEAQSFFKKFELELPDDTCQKGFDSRISALSLQLSGTTDFEAFSKKVGNVDSLKNNYIALKINKIDSFQVLIKKRLGKLKLSTDLSKNISLYLFGDKDKTINLRAEHTHTGKLLKQIKAPLTLQTDDNFTDTEGVKWYHLNYNGVEGWVSGLFAVKTLDYEKPQFNATIKVAKAFFYDITNGKFVARKQFLSKADWVQLLNRSYKGYAQVKYRNPKTKIITIGWIKLTELDN